MAALPTNINYTTVVGRFIRAVADTNDSGKEPDASPAVGLSVIFRPSVDVVVDDLSSPPVTIMVDSITCTTDNDGYLLGPDSTPGVLLIASADEDLRPHHWTWTVTVEGSNFKRVTSTFITQPGATVDLATVVQVPSSPGAAISQWAAAVAATEAARDVVLAAIEDIPAGGSGAWSDITGKPETFTPSSHTHATSEVVGLDSALSSKATASHTHTTGNVTGLDAALAAKAPLASPAFTGMPTGITKAHVGLGAVDNTADADKPVSTAAQAALDGKAASSHTHTAANVSDFSTAADARITASTTIVKTTGAQTVAGVKTFSSAPVVPDSSFTIAKVAALQGALDAKVAGTGIASIVSITQTAYNALGTYPATTFYVITGA